MTNLKTLVLVVAVAVVSVVITLAATGESRSKTHKVLNESGTLIISGDSVYFTPNHIDGVLYSPSIEELEALKNISYQYEGLYINLAH